LTIISNTHKSLYWIRREKSSNTEGRKVYSVNGKVKYPKMAKKSTHYFLERLNRLRPSKEVKSSFSESKPKRRNWDVRSSHAYND